MFLMITVIVTIFLIEAIIDDTKYFIKERKNRKGMNKWKY